MSVPLQQALFAGDETTIASAMALLIHYYDLAPASSRMLLNKWLQRCPADWVRAAVIEALYQGRYRPVSVEQILAFWIRRGKLTSHYNREFEALIAVPIQRDLMPQGQAAALATIPRRPKIPLQPTALRVKSSPDGNRIQPPVEPANSSGDDSTPSSSAASSQASMQGHNANLLEPPLRIRSSQMHQPPIDQFTPAEDPSGFSLGLQEVAGQFQVAMPMLPAATTPSDRSARSGEPFSSHLSLVEEETGTDSSTSEEATGSENSSLEDSVSE